MKLREEKLIEEMLASGWQIKLKWLKDASFGEIHYPSKTITINLSMSLVSTFIHELRHYELRTVPTEPFEEENDVLAYEKKRIVYLRKLKPSYIRRLAKKILEVAS